MTKSDVAVAVVIGAMIATIIFLSVNLLVDEVAYPYFQNPIEMNYTKDIGTIVLAPRQGITPDFATVGFGYRMPTALPTPQIRPILWVDYAYKVSTVSQHLPSEDHITPYGTFSVSIALARTEQCYVDVHFWQVFYTVQDGVAITNYREIAVASYTFIVGEHGIIQPEPSMIYAAPTYGGS